MILAITLTICICHLNIYAQGKYETPCPGYKSYSIKPHLLLAVKVIWRKNHSFCWCNELEYHFFNQNGMAARRSFYLCTYL